jgi:REP element-mobilizing transposase RayT
MTLARKDLVSPEITRYYHCVGRCVRRAFLCGTDHFSGRSFEHRRQWVVDRVRVLAEVFAIEVAAYAVMSNHYHLVLRLSPEQVAAWTDEEVEARWRRLFRLSSGHALTEEELATRLPLWRERLGSLSWFMRCLNEPIARAANREDGCTGRFWEGRFKTQALIGEAALLTCMAYVELNPIRAQMADRPEVADHTSIQTRIKRALGLAVERAPDLMPCQGENPRPDRTSHIPLPLPEYLQLVDLTGRAIRAGKRGAIPADLPPVLERLGIASETWIGYMRRTGARFHRIIAPVEDLKRLASRWRRKFLKGQSLAGRLFPSH